MKALIESARPAYTQNLRQQNSPRSFPLHRAIVSRPDGRAELDPPGLLPTLRNDDGFWQLTFDGEQAAVKCEPGAFYVSVLLARPNERPLTALEVAAAHANPCPCFDLPGALAASAKQLTNGSELSFEINTKGRVRPLPDTLEENLLRIAQEAMTNVVKHSQATSAQIELDYGPQNILLRVKDNGCGFEPITCDVSQRDHFGLLGIKERVASQFGMLSVDSAPGKGTKLLATIPTKRAVRVSARRIPEDCGFADAVRPKR